MEDVCENCGQDEDGSPAQGTRQTAVLGAQHEVQPEAIQQHLIDYQQPQAHSQPGQGRGGDHPQSQQSGQADGLQHTPIQQIGLDTQGALAAGDDRAQPDKGQVAASEVAHCSLDTSLFDPPAVGKAVGEADSENEDRCAQIREIHSDIWDMFEPGRNGLNS